MTDENDDIPAQDEPDFNTVLEAEEETQDTPRKGVGRGFVLSGFLLSTLFGGALGIIGTKMLAGPDETGALKIELAQSLTALEKSSQTQTKKLGTANNVQKKTKAQLNTLQDANETLTEQIDNLTQRITDMQKAARDDTSATELTDRIAVLEALSSEDADVFNGVGSIAARLNALEDKIVDVKQLPAQDMQDAANGQSAEPELEEPAETGTEISAGSSVDETRIPVTPPVNTEQQAALDILIKTFPRAKMLAAVKAQETSASSKSGWLKRALSKHVKVRNDDEIDPYATIDAAEAALMDGHITTALEHIAKLNPPVRTSAAEWVQAAKKSTAIIEEE